MASTGPVTTITASVGEDVEGAADARAGLMREEFETLASERLDTDARG